MIINLTGKLQNDEIKFNLFPLYFENHQEIKALYIGIEWVQPVGDVHGFLTSSLIDQSPMNENQELIRFHNVNRSNYTFYAPVNPAVYKVQCNSFLSSFFQLHLSKQYKIREIHLQLEIKWKDFQDQYNFATKNYGRENKPDSEKQL